MNTPAVQPSSYGISYSASLLLLQEEEPTGNTVDSGSKAAKVMVEVPYHTPLGHLWPSLYSSSAMSHQLSVSPISEVSLVGLRAEVK